MPNNIENIIVFHGTAARIGKICKMLAAEQHPYNTIAPLPYYEETYASYRCWPEDPGKLCREYAWKAYEAVVENLWQPEKIPKSRRSLGFSCASAWGPPEGLIKKLLEKNHTFDHLFCCEGGPEFSSVVRYDRGWEADAKDFIHVNRLDPLARKICIACWGRDPIDPVD